MYAAAALSSYKKEKGGIDAILLEKMHRCGLKIGITGKGRCNLTNTKPWNEFSTHIHPKNVFLKNAFYASSNTAVMENFEKMGLPLVVERGDRVFPQSMKALDVVSTLERYILQGGIQLRKNSEVSSVAKGDDGFFAIKCSDGFECSARKVIIATGGMSYQTTGSSGDGYIFAKGLFAAFLRTRPLRWIYSLGLVLLAKINAVFILGIFTPSSKHLIATIA